MAAHTGTPMTRRALTAAVQRCYRISAAYRSEADPVVKADLFTAAADAVAAYKGAYTAHHGRPPVA